MSGRSRPSRRAGCGNADVYCRDGATTARFLPALAAAGHGVFRFDASEQMRARPLGPLTDALLELGVDLTFEGEPGHHPLVVNACGIKGGNPPSTPGCRRSS